MYSIRYLLRLVKKKNTESTESIADTAISNQIAMPIRAVETSLWSDLQMLAPFGIGNTKPVFKLQNLLIKSAKVFGKTKEHVECILSHDEPLADDELLYVQKRKEFKAIHFFSKFVDQVDALSGKTATCLVHCEISYFGGKIEKRFRIIDIISI